MNAEIVKIFDMLKRNIIDIDAAQSLIDTMFANAESDVEVNIPEREELPWSDDGKIRIVAYLGREMLTNAEVKDKTSDITISLDCDPKDVEVRCGNLSCSCINGNVYGYGGEIKVDSITGNIQSEKPVTVNRDVNGDVSAVGTVQVARDINGNVKGHVIVRGSSEEKSKEGMSENFKDFGRSISDMLNTSLGYATDAINNANEALKNNAAQKGKEGVYTTGTRVVYTDVSDIDDDSIRIGLVKGGKIINTFDVAEKITVDLSDFEPCDLYCSGNVVCDCVSGDIHAGGNVTCADVEGSICSANEVTCDNVEGDIHNCTTVRCDCIDGSVSDCVTVNSNDINGDIRECQIVNCDEVSGDMYNCSINRNQ